MLNAFEKASGQKINDNKSLAFFSRNTEAIIRAEICGILNFNEADGNTQYLGLPNTLGYQILWEQVEYIGLLKESNAR